MNEHSAAHAVHVRPRAHCAPASSPVRAPLQVRALRSSQRLHALAGGSDGLLVLPLHGGLPPSQQSRVFERPAPGVRKVRKNWIRKKRLLMVHLPCRSKLEPLARDVCLSAGVESLVKGSRV